ncbi:hypothetical protein JOS77_29180 [Chromobacterium haemolyticum]|nr:hypothetical protein JOS77_29180 [Chromobacterium haemolyticum]
MARFEIPLITGPQHFSIQMGSQLYQMTLIYRSAQDSNWVLDIADSSGNPLVSGIALVTGIDLLAQHQHLGFGCSLYVQTDGDPDAIPDYQSLGVTGRLFFETTT